MYQFAKVKILPIFLKRRIPIYQLANKAGVCKKTAQRAVDGLPITAKVVDRVARALGIAPLDFLIEGSEEIEIR